MLWIRRLSSLPPTPRHRHQRVVILLAAIVAAICSASASADWVGSSGYLWNMNAPFSITVESHADAAWTQRLTQSAADWSASGVVSVSVANKGKIALYDGYYGSGQPCAWTQYWQRGGHISHDAVYMNETCLAGWTDYWKQYAVCQELGHALGMLDHNTTPTVPSCMAPSMAATSPSSEDFAELALLYGMGPSSTKGGKGSGGTGFTALAAGTTAAGPGNGGTAGGGSERPTDPGQSTGHGHHGP